MSDERRPKKLTFKGEKKTKKRHRTEEDGPSEPGSSSKRSKTKQVEHDPSHDADWVFPDDPAQIRGPTFIYHPSDPSALSINFDATRKRLNLYALTKDTVQEGEEPQTLLEKTPHDVSQVWVTTRIAGNPTVNLRTGVGEGKFMSCDAHGLVSCDRDARGPQEEWSVVLLPDGMVAFMNVYEKYLSVDEVAGGNLSLRGDSEEVGFGERFWVKIQQKYKNEANAEEKKKKEGAPEPSIDEASTNKMYQTWGAGKSVVSHESKAELKSAKKDGRLAEAMLDRRAKLKSDRFC